MRQSGRRNGFPNQATESELFPAPTARSSTLRPNYTIAVYAEGLGPSHAGSLVVGLVSVNPYELMLFSPVGFLVVSLTSLSSTILPPYLLQGCQFLCSFSLLFPSFVSFPMCCMLWFPWTQAIFKGLSGTCACSLSISLHFTKYTLKLLIFSERACRILPKIWVQFSGNHTASSVFCRYYIVYINSPKNAHIHIKINKWTIWIHMTKKENHVFKIYICCMLHNQWLMSEQGRNSVM